MSFSDVATSLMKPVSNQMTKAGYILKAKSPEILLVSGVIGIVGGTVLACRATLKAKDVIEDMQGQREIVDQATALVADPDNDKYTDETYSADDRKKDILSIYVKGGAKLFLMYAPAIVVTGLGIAAILTSHGIMKKRNLALISAYDSLSAGFEAYRKRAVEQLGEDMDKKLRYGLTDEEVDAVAEDKNGNAVATKKTLPAFSASEVGPYAVWFGPDTSSEFWSDNPGANTFFLNAKQNQLNDLLHSRGFVFVNEVRQALGIKINKEGQMYGWMTEPDCKGYIDLGMFAAYNHDSVNGTAADGVNAYLLDLQPDGYILDRI